MRFFSNTTLENQVCRPKSGINLYPFGMEMPGRKWVSSDYRYSFNGKEDDKEINSGAQDFGLREYDSRLGRFFSKDPYSRFLPNKTPYCFAGNSPITFIDEDGGFQVIPEVSGSGKNYKALMRVVKAVSRMANENKGNNDFVNTFMLMSGVSREKALEILSYGSGPVVIATTNEQTIGSGIPGRTLAGKYVRNICVDGQDVNGICEFVFINDLLLDNINNTGDKRSSVLSNIIAAVTLWHEGMHYADYLDLTVQPPNSAGEDIGTQAEMSLFGFRPDYDNLTTYNKTKERNINSPTPSNPNYFLGTNSAINMFWSKYNHGGNFGKSYNVNLSEVGRTIKNIANAIGRFITGVFKGGDSQPKKKGGTPSF
ncbi:MAG: RHS repeat domain-containing protein [Bacteroidota bacterium]